MNFMPRNFALPVIQLEDARELFEGLDQIHLASIVPDPSEGDRVIEAHDFGKDIDRALLWARAANEGGKNIHWTVNSVEAGLHRKPNALQIVHARFIHLDIDPPSGSPDWLPDQALQELLQFSHPPSFAFFSGNGLQAFWRLKGLVEDLSVVQTINMTARDRFKGDKCHNIASLMRVPGFVNHPNASKRGLGRTPALASWAAPDKGVIYDLDDLKDAFGVGSKQVYLPSPAIQQSSYPVVLEEGAWVPLTPDDLGLPKDSKARAAIEEPKHEDRSKNGFIAACRLIEAGFERRQVMGILLNGANAVSAHYLEQSDPLRAASRAFEEALKRKPRSVNENFRVSSYGVEKKVETPGSSKNPPKVEWHWICSELEVEACTRTAASDDWGRLLVLTDRDGLKKHWAMPMELLSGDGKQIRERLLSMGCDIATGTSARNALNDYIATAPARARVRCATSVGWNGDVFVLPDVAFCRSGSNTERVVFQNAAAPRSAYGLSGTLEAWKSDLANYARGNSRLVVALCTAFAGPLLKLCGVEGGTLHLVGKSSAGKTTALKAAGSVWGGEDYPRTWRATSNGLEGIASLHNDTFLPIDEIGQADSRDVAAAAYMLAQGQGKARAMRDGTPARPVIWRTLLLSTGEHTLAAKIAEDGKARSSAGQEVRFVDIPADAGAGLGIFEDLHGFATPRDFAEHIAATAGANYGHASHAFLSRLANSLPEAVAQARACIEQFCKTYCPTGADSQVQRVAARFGLVAAAGELATSWKVLPWEQGTATDAAARCYADWIEARGGLEAGEERDHLAAVRRFVELHGSSRFEIIRQERLQEPAETEGSPADYGTGQRVINRAGYKYADLKEGGETYFCFSPEVFKSEVCAGFNSMGVARSLNKHGLLLTSKDSLQRQMRIPGNKQPVRLYVVRSAILGTNSRQHAV